MVSEEVETASINSLFKRLSTNKRKKMEQQQKGKYECRNMLRKYFLTKIIKMEKLRHVYKINETNRKGEVLAAVVQGKGKSQNETEAIRKTHQWQCLVAAE